MGGDRKWDGDVGTGTSDGGLANFIGAEKTGQHSHLPIHNGETITITCLLHL